MLDPPDITSYLNTLKHLLIFIPPLLVIVLYCLTLFLRPRHK